MRFPNPIKFFKSLYHFVRRPEIAPDEVQEKRRDICSVCVFFDDRIDQCNECTCFVDFKIIMATEFCPVQRWGQYFNQLKNGLPKNPRIAYGRRR